MNKREKRLLIATLSIVGVWLLSVLLASDPAEANTESAEPSETTTSAPPAQRQPAASATAGNVAPLTAYRFDPQQLEALVELRRASALFVPVHADPFGELPSLTNPKKKKDLPFPKIHGLYRSGGARGALLDESVCFEGDLVADTGFRLLRVTDDSVVLEYDRKEHTRKYDPMRNDTEPSTTKAKRRHDKR